MPHFPPKHFRNDSQAMRILVCRNHGRPACHFVLRFLALVHLRDSYGVPLRSKYPSVKISSQNEKMLSKIKYQSKFEKFKYNYRIILIQTTRATIILPSTRIPSSCLLRRSVLVDTPNILEISLQRNPQSPSIKGVLLLATDCKLWSARRLVLRAFSVKRTHVPLPTFC